MRNSLLTLLALAGLMALSACGGGGGGAGDQPDPDTGQDVLVDYQYTGEYTPRSASSVSRSTSQSNFGTLRLIDPDENIHVGEADGSSTDTITFESVEVQPTYSLEFNFTVPQDLRTGELNGTTDVTFTVPLTVDDGGDTTVDTNMSIASEEGTTTMLASYEVTSPTSSSSRVLRVDYQTGTVQEDMNGDGNFDDDPSWSDENRNGLDDATDDSLPEAARSRGTGEIESEDVVIAEVDTENYISLTAGGQTWQMNGLTNVVDRRGDDDEPVSRGALATGLTVDIKGFQRGAADPMATRIRIDEGEDGGDDDGFQGKQEVEVDEVTLTNVNLQAGFVIADGQRWELREVTTVRDERDASESDNAPFSRLEQGLLVDIKGWMTNDGTYISRRIDIEDDQPGGGPGNGGNDDDNGDDDDDSGGDDDGNSGQGNGDDNPGQGNGGDDPGNGDGDDNPGQGDDDSDDGDDADDDEDESEDEDDD